MLKVIRSWWRGAIIVALAWALAGIPGHLVASIGDFTLETSTPVAILILIALVVVILILLRILQTVVGIPGQP